MAPEFKTGDKVKYVGHSTGGITKGEIYTIAETYLSSCVLREPVYFVRYQNLENLSNGNGLQRAALKTYPRAEDCHKAATKLARKITKAFKIVK